MHKIPIEKLSYRLALNCDLGCAWILLMKFLHRLKFHALFVANFWKLISMPVFLWKSKQIIELSVAVSEILLPWMWVIHRDCFDAVFTSQSRRSHKHSFSRISIDQVNCRQLSTAVSFVVTKRILCFQLTKRLLSRSSNMAKYWANAFWCFNALQIHQPR